jgi:MoxR-like ATPase
MVQGRDTSNPFDDLESVASIEDVQSMIAAARAIYVSPAVEQYAVDIAQATRDDAELRLGASPRATLQLVRAAKARAAVQGRDFVLPDDIDVLIPVVLPHRLIPMRGVASAADVMERIVAETPVPAGAVQPT